MVFRYYFFKEGTRRYDVAELLSYFKSDPYIDIINKNESEKVAHYKNPILNFSCEFIIASKSSVPNIERLNPKYVEVNLRVEFDVILPTYDVDLIIDMCEDICRTHGFCVYNEAFEDVLPFKRSIMLRAFELVKKSYKDSYPLKIADYYRLDKESLNNVYNYLKQTNLISLNLGNISVPKISFYAIDGKRKVYTSVEISALEPFVFPGFVDMVHVVSPGRDMFIASNEFYNSARKLFHSMESNIPSLYYTTPKEMKKLNKILTKTSFSPLILELKKVEFSKVLDI